MIIALLNGPVIVKLNSYLIAKKMLIFYEPFSNQCIVNFQLLNKLFFKAFHCLLTVKYI